MPQINGVSRRAFLKYLGLNMAAMAIRPMRGWGEIDEDDWSILDAGKLPLAVQQILEIAPQAEVALDGRLSMAEPGQPASAVPLTPTKWNREHSQRWDRLEPGIPWGIVLHWFGDPQNFKPSVESYLRGFDGLRLIDGELTSTSAHFLVGDAAPSPANFADQRRIAVLQTQAPAPDGAPYQAAHVLPLDILAHREKRQYFVRAQYELEQAGRGPHTLLQDMFDGRLVNPNMRTIAIEITGSHFDEPGSEPSKSKTANVLALVWALMRRYRIPAVNLLGHHEIQLGKADPGKKFMALIRFLLGIKALVEHDLVMFHLVFGAYGDLAAAPQQAVRRYFSYLRDFLVITATQREVFEWERNSKYWFTLASLAGARQRLPLAKSLLLPLRNEGLRTSGRFLDPANHEGLDLFRVAGKPARVQDDEIRLVADSECLYAGSGVDSHPGVSVIFRHIEPGGAQVLNIFGNLSQAASLHVGRIYPAGELIGCIEHGQHRTDPFLHLAVAYGATWDTDLQRALELPLNVGPNWIAARYLDPWLYFHCK
jgi:hypothetical protein